MKVRAWDSETTTYGFREKGVSPYLPNNWVVMHGYVEVEVDEALRATTPFSRKQWYNTQPPADGWLAAVLEGCGLLVGANLKFDLAFATFRQPKNEEALKAFFNRGGRVWDILHAEHALRGFTEETKMVSLDTVCVKYGGKVKEDQVKAMWAQGISTESIPVHILQHYLMGTEDHPGDVGNTLLAFLGQVQLKQFPSMKKALQLDMLALMDSMRMERNGIYFHVETGEALREQAHKDLAAATEAFLKYCPEEHRPFVNCTGARFKSAVLYGGEVSYTRKAYLSVDGEESWEQWPEGKQAYPKKTIKEPVVDEAGNPVIFKSGKQAGQQKMRNVEVPDTDKPPKTRNVEVTFTLPRRVTPVEGTENANGYSTSSDVLDLITDVDPCLEDLRTLALHAKDVSTNYWIEDPKTGKRKGLMTKLNEDSVFHPSIRSNNTVTGRFSCDSPNLQNVSKVTQVKKAFQSRWGEDGRICQPDFTSLESYSIGIITGDEKMLADLNDPHFDMHCSAVAFVKNITVEEAIRLCKKDKEPGWPELRQQMKGANFAYEYGAGAATISRQAQIPLETAERFIEFRRNFYPVAVQYKERVHASVNASVRFDGEVRRHPVDPRFTYRTGKGLWREKTGRVWAFPVKPASVAQAKRGVTESVPPTDTGNYPFQGTGADWMKAVMALSWLTYCQGLWPEDVLPICTVHDAYYIDYRKEHHDAAINTISWCFDHSNDVMSLLGLDMKARVPYSCNYGANWKEENASEPVLPEITFNFNSIFEYVK